MNSNNVHILSNNIRNINRGNLEEMYLIFKMSFSNLIMYILTSKSKMDVPQICLKIVGQFFSIIREERRILNFLLSHSKYIKKEDMDDFLIELDALNEETFNFFEKYLGDIEDAIVQNQPWRLNYSKNFLFLNESNEYQYRARDMVLTFDLLKDLLDYDSEFWDYIDSRIVIVNNKDDVNVKWVSSDDLNDIKIMVPEIKSYESFLINMRMFSKAYVLYSSSIKRDYKLKKISQEDFKDFYLRLNKYFER